MREVFSNPDYRLLALRLRCCCFRCLHDLQDRPGLRQEKPDYLPLYLLYRWVHFCHVCQGFWYRSQAYLCRPQPIQPPFDLRFHDLDNGLHPDSDELLQQGSCKLPHQHVSN